MSARCWGLTAEEAALVRMYRAATRVRTADYEGFRIADRSEWVQVACVAEEGGELLKAYRAATGNAAKPSGDWDSVREEYGDVLMASFVLAHQPGFRGVVDTPDGFALIAPAERLVLDKLARKGLL